MYRVEYKDGSVWKVYHEYKYDRAEAFTEFSFKKAVGIFYSLDRMFGQGNVRIMNKETLVYSNY